MVIFMNVYAQKLTWYFTDVFIINVYITMSPQINSKKYPLLPWNKYPFSFLPQNPWEALYDYTSLSEQTK